MKQLYTVIALLLCMIPAPSQPKYEVRAVWLTTIGGIDWPSVYAHDGSGTEAQQRQLTDMLDRLQAANVNTVLLQTRIRATTIYPSDMEPWDGCLSGTPGRSPGYDALQFAIDECHRRGMELHAWVVTLPIGKWQSYGCRQLRSRQPGLVRRIGDEGYLNPESERTADYLADICHELVNRYDLDGLHLDYIRYPETWRGHKSHHNITRIVRRIHDRVKAVKPWVKLSCAPIGKSDDLSRYSSRGWNAYRTVAQDAQGWLRDGLMDQLYPMLYFKENHFYPFALDWQEQSQGRTIVAGLGTYQLDGREGNWPLSEIVRQLNVTRQAGMGHCHFRVKYLLNNTKGVLDYTNAFDRHPALIPPMTWEHATPPPAPDGLRVERTDEGDNVSWQGVADADDGLYLLYNIYASDTEPVDIGDPANLVATRQRATTVSIPRDRRKAALHYAVTALDRYGNESRPAREPAGGISLAATPAATLLHNDGRTLAVPQFHLFDAPRLAVCDMKGREVLSCPSRPHVDIGSLPDGMYQLRSVARKKKYGQRRLGYFIIKRK